MMNQPLAERMRPKTLDDYIGQQHLVGQGAVLRKMLDAGHVPSFILWGPPGVGKTTLAYIISNQLQVPFYTLSAISSGVKEVREVIDKAKSNRFFNTASPILFIDEIHRFSKAQQDSLLNAVETGVVTLIGATTENPSFEVIRPLLSRCQVYVLKALGKEDLLTLLKKAVSEDVVLKTLPIVLEETDALLRFSGGDARKLLNILDLVVSAEDGSERIEITDQKVVERLQENPAAYDKGGEMHYDIISAFIKSVRGSDPDAALYWMTRMLVGGCDPLYICRRVIRMATEDIGLADPRALEIALNAAQTFERLGSPEGELAIANAVVYCAIAPKSNSIEMAYNAVKSFVKKDATRPVPLYLRNAPTKLMSELGYSHGYRYAHDEPDAFAAGEIYLPEGLENMKWYYPRPRGLEIKIAEKLERLKALNRQAWAKGEGRIRTKKDKYSSVQIGL